jgi:hypothetical protein
MQRALVVLAIMVGVAMAGRDAAAGELRAHVECTIGTRPVVAGKKQVLDGHLTCALVIDDGYPEVDPAYPRDARAVAWLSQGGVDLSAQRLLETTKLTGDPAVTYPLGTFLRSTDFARCTGLVVHAQIASGDESLWEGTLPIAASCKPAKKMKAKLTCAYWDRAGDAYAWPGSGAKRKPKLDDSLSCSVTVPGLKNGDGHAVRLAGSPAALGATPAEPLYLDDDRAWTHLAILEPDLDFTPCTPVTVAGSLTNADGQTVWTGTLKLAQACSN